MRQFLGLIYEWVLSGSSGTGLHSLQKDIYAIGDLLPSHSEEIWRELQAHFAGRYAALGVVIVISLKRQDCDTRRLPVFLSHITHLEDYSTMAEAVDIPQTGELWRLLI